MNQADQDEKHAPRPLTSLLVGPFERAEFAPAADSLRAWGPTWSVAELPNAIRWADGTRSPDLIVIAQAYAGQLSPPLLRALVQRLPLARLVHLLGSWCEGELRTGHPWPAAGRLFWYEWPARAPQVLAEMAAGKCSAWSQPVTTTPEERLLCVPPGTGCEDLQVGRTLWIATPHASSFRALGTAARQLGADPVRCRPGELGSLDPPLGAVWDGGSLRRKEQQELRRFAAQAAPARTVAVLDFPRLETVRLTRRLGVAQLLAKPLRIEDLRWALGLDASRRVTDAAGPQGPAAQKAGRSEP